MFLLVTTIISKYCLRSCVCKDTEDYETVANYLGKESGNVMSDSIMALSKL